MSNEADRVIAALHSGAEELTPFVQGLTEDQLTGPSAATEWDMSQVISHLGSGAVITLATLDAALAGKPNPGVDANRRVWAEWDAMSPRQRVDRFTIANAELLARYDSVDAPTRESLRVDLGFLPAPVDLATAARFRLTEFSLHSWDVRVILDRSAVVHPAAAALLLDQLELMLGWLAKPAVLDGRPVVLRVGLVDPVRSFGLSLGEQCSIGDVPSDPDGELSAPAEAWLRLATGRLAPEYTPAGVTVTGALPLQTLRAVFPGY